MLCIRLLTFSMAFYFVETSLLARNLEENKNSSYNCNILERIVHLEIGWKKFEKRCRSLEDIVAKQDQEIDKLKELSVGGQHTVYAEIQLPAKTTLNDGQTITFTHPVNNVGNAYNTVFGFFEAPVSGTYFFSATLCSYSNSWFVFGLVQDNRVLDESFVGDNTWHQCMSSNAVTYMTTGSKVWVKLFRRHNGVMDKAWGVSSFTGVLLNQFPKL